MVTLVLLISLVCTVIQIYFWMGRFRSLEFSQAKPCLTQGPPVSVIICARNEASNIRRYLPEIMTQYYDPFEVILVNDGSTDATGEVCNELQKEYPHLILTHTSGVGKKLALRTGIDLAAHDILVFTDADCKPGSQRWIGYLVAGITEGYSIVLGRAPFFKRTGWVNTFACYENHLTFFQYGSAVLKKKPFIGVGRNMAVHNVVLQKFPYKERHLGGDDDLLVNRLDEQDTICLVDHPDAYMYSESKQSWPAFFHQKRRHVSVSWEYRQDSKFYILLYAATHWGHYITLLVLLHWGFILFTISFYCIRSACILYCLHQLVPEKERLSDGKALVSDALFIIYYPILSIFLLMKTPERW